ncbi:hypothetical protein Lal_00026107 [Lupinus albus]|nr:hypothetical protein Lal_00026107 [Lupinus albus]
MVSHILRRDPTYPKQVSKGRRELESRVLPLLKLVDEYQSSLPLEKLSSLTSLQFLTLKCARELSIRRGSSRSSEDLTASTGPKYHFSRPGETTLAHARQLSLKREFFSIAQDFTLPGCHTRDCYQLFFDEKKKLKAWFAKSCNHVCMTTDCWTSNQNLGYMCLTSHFIDEDWRLQKRILNFCLVESHKSETIGREIERCLREWRIERVFTITVDNASSNDGEISYI